MKPMLKTRLIYLIFLLFAVLFFIFFDGYLSLYILRLVIFLPIVSLLISLPGIFCARLKLTTDTDAVQRGQTLSVRATVENRLPVFSGIMKVTLTVRNTFTGETTKEQMSLPFGRRAVAMTYRAGSSGCGRLFFELSGARACDCMGLFSLPVHLGRDARCSAVVYPVVCRADLISEPMERPSFESERYSTVQPGDDPFELYSLREFRDGDRLSRVHWKLSEKLGTTVVKDFGMPIVNGVFILLQLDGTAEEADALLDSFVSLADFLLREKGFWAGFWSVERDSFTVAEISDGEALRTVLNLVLSSHRKLQRQFVREDMLPASAAHIVYLCAKPSSAVLEAVRRRTPLARLSVLQTAPIVADDAETVRVSGNDISGSLNGFRI